MLEWPTVTTALVALYGAILSSYNALAARKEKRPQVRVSVSFGVKVCGSPLIGGEAGPPLLFVEASNPGRRTVTLSSLGLLLAKKRQLFLDPHSEGMPFPYDLEPGKSYRMWVAASRLASWLKQEGLQGKVKLVGFYDDAVGNRYRSRKLSFNCEKWLAK